MNLTQSFLTCNTTLEDSYIDEEPLWSGGLTFHRLGLILCAAFGLVSVIIALLLVFRHATHYLKPVEQRNIIRILLMIPVYSIVSFFSIVFYRKSVYFDVLRDCYEAFAIASFFALLCNYVAPNLHDQKEYFRTLTPVNWFWKMFGLQYLTGGENKGILRRPRSGLTWFNIIWLGVFQYCFIRVLFTIVSVVTEATGRYCEASLSPAYAHIWVTAFECVSVFIAMTCLIQFYIQLRGDLAEHRPFLKVLCIKLVIFFSFWQTQIISLISSSHGPLQPTSKLAYQDIKNGLPSMLLCIEMALFAVLHIFAFDIKPYSIKDSYSDPLTEPGTGFSGSTDGLRYKGGPLGTKAYIDALNPWDFVKASARGFRWMFVGYKKREQDISYQRANGATKLDGNGSTAYLGPAYAASGEAATELHRPSNDDGAAAATATRLPIGGDLSLSAGGRGRTDTLAADDDRAGLLSNSAQPPRSPLAMPYGAEEDVWERKAADERSGYHPGYFTGASGTHPMAGGGGGVGGVQQPNFSYPSQQAQQQGSAGGAGWNHWAGVHGEQEAGADGGRGTRPPPSYVTNDDDVDVRR